MGGQPRYPFWCIPYVGTSEPGTLVLCSSLLSRLFHVKRYGLLCPDLFRDKLQMFYTAKYSKSLSLPVPFALLENFCVVIYPDIMWTWENQSHGNGGELSFGNTFYSNRKKEILCSRSMVFSPLIRSNTCIGTVFEWILLILTKSAFKVHLSQSDGIGKKIQHMFPTAKCQSLPF